MTESKESRKTKTWQVEQSWIKDVLSKSGTELVDISKSNVKIVNERKNGKKTSKDTNAKNKMVYHQSTQLLIKSEQPSQAQFCLPLPQQQQAQRQQQIVAAPTSSTTTYLETLHTPQQQQYIQQQLQQQQQQQQQQQTTSITTTTTTTALNNIKTEAYNTSSNSSNIGATIYLPATSSNTNTNGSAASNVSSSTAPPLPQPKSMPGRKPNPNKPQFKCEQCGMSFGSKSAHTSHTKSHAKNAELSGMPALGAGQVQPAIELNEAGLPMGIPKSPTIQPLPNVAAGGDPYQCNVCQKTFAVPARLIRHYRTHTGERPFECEFCHKLFSVKENLQVHRRIHTKERPYKCEVCGRAFEHSGKLHRHMRIHTGERPHKCSVCEKTFIQSGQLVIHMRTHTGEKPYKCPVEGCGKGFTCSKQLKVHSRTHTGEKPYHCDICFRDFGYNHVLKLHRVQHYGSKCYKCTICDETFKSKKEMEAHIKGHANELPDDEESGAASGAVEATSTSSAGSSSSTGDASNSSPPSSPQSPTTTTTTTNTSTTPAAAAATNAVIAKPKKTRQPRAAKAIASQQQQQQQQQHQQQQQQPQQQHQQPMSPSSPSSTYSPTSSGAISLASNSRYSAGSPSSSTSSVASPTMLITHETDHHSRDSGVSSAGHQQPQAPPVLLLPPQQQQQQQQHFTQLQPSYIEDMPTDLSMQQQQPPTTYYAPTYISYQRVHAPSPPPPSTVATQLTALTSLSPQQHLQPLQQQLHSPPLNNDAVPTINPALLEAASIRRALLEPREDDDVQAALQIMELRRGYQPQYQPATVQPTPEAAPTGPILTTLVNQQQQQQQQQAQPTLHVSDIAANYDDTHEANVLIEHYKRGDLARHGWHKGYAPVPKYESSLPNNTDIVRRVEAAIGLRSSTESPERSSSPESDSIMMADRNVMTLPLRKRKLYMNEGNAAHAERDASSPERNGHSAINSNGNDEIALNGNSNVGVGVSANNPKVMRMSSVIQFAKAS